MASSLVIRDLTGSDLDPLLSLYTHLHEADDPLPTRAGFYGLYESLGFDRHAKQAFVIGAR
jgi:hypothetical protein